MAYAKETSLGECLVVALLIVVKMSMSELQLLYQYDLNFNRNLEFQKDGIFFQRN